MGAGGRSRGGARRREARLPAAGAQAQRGVDPGPDAREGGRQAHLAPHEAPGRSVRRPGRPPPVLAGLRAVGAHGRGGCRRDEPGRGGDRGGHASRCTGPAAPPGGRAAHAALPGQRALLAGGVDLRGEARRLPGGRAEGGEPGHPPVPERRPVHLPLPGGGEGGGNAPGGRGPGRGTGRARAGRAPVLPGVAGPQPPRRERGRRACVPREPGHPLRVRPPLRRRSGPPPASAPGAEAAAPDGGARRGPGAVRRPPRDPG